MQGIVLGAAHMKAIKQESSQQWNLELGNEKKVVSLFQLS